MRLILPVALTLLFYGSHAVSAQVEQTTPSLLLPAVQKLRLAITLGNPTLFTDLQLSTEQRADAMRLAAVARQAVSQAYQLTGTARTRRLRQLNGHSSRVLQRILNSNQGRRLAILDAQFFVRFLLEPQVATKAGLTSQQIRALRRITRNTGAAEKADQQVAKMLSPAQQSVVLDIWFGRGV